MTIEEYIAANREEIDAVIKSILGESILGAEVFPSQVRDDDDREDWIVNVESMYLAAKQAGVDFAE